ncbi:hypothetical protein JLT2_62 [Paraglaciecola Antarctic JLT virus 2]|nr:hypothetical protein JLT2_62 [Paraglaciecola Antarctic JLT virus 2]
MIILGVILYLWVGVFVSIIKCDSKEVDMWGPHLVMYCIDNLINKLDR